MKLEQNRPESTDAAVGMGRIDSCFPELEFPSYPVASFLAALLDEQRIHAVCIYRSSRCASLLEAHKAAQYAELAIEYALECQN